MQPLPRMIVKNVVVAAVLGLAAIATWAFTDTAAPTIEARALADRQG